jgi:hypothetical protein
LRGKLFWSCLLYFKGKRAEYDVFPRNLQILFVILSLSGKAIHCSRLFRKLMNEDHSYTFFVSCSLPSLYICHFLLLLVEKCYKVILVGVNSNYIRYLAIRNHNSGLIFIIHAGIREGVTPWTCLLVEKRMVAHRAKKYTTLCSTQMTVTTTVRRGHWSLFLAACFQFAVSQIISSIKRFLAKVLFAFIISATHATWPARLAVYLVNLTICDAVQKLWSVCLHNFFHSPSASCLTVSKVTLSTSSQRPRISVILSVQEFKLHLCIKRAKLFLICAVTGQKTWR